MRIALYKGTSWTSRIIKFVTRSQYSHAAFLFDEAAEKAAERIMLDRADVYWNLHYFARGSVVEAWEPGGVRNVPSLSRCHTPKTVVDVYEFVTPLTPNEEEQLLIHLSMVIGEHYDWTNVFRFISKRPDDKNSDWFCSELVVDRLESIGRKLFHRTAAWEVPPDWIPRSLQLVKIETQVTR